MTSLRLKPATRTQLQRAAKLHRREQRTRHGQFLVEGPQSVREVLAFAPEVVRDLYVSEGAFESYPEIRELAAGTGVWTHSIDDDELRDLSGDAQGFVVVADVPVQKGAAELLAEAPLAIAAVGASDPGNVGSIVRSADAAGASAVLLTKGCAEVTAPKVVRSTVGSLFHVPAATNLNLE
ncbi:MAG: TrmH family RNA methyltransferase, partial [Ancrocorticia sp.]